MAKYVAMKHFKLGSSHFNEGEDLPDAAVKRLKEAHADGNLEASLKSGLIMLVDQAPAAKAEKPADAKPEAKK